MIILENGILDTVAPLPANAAPPAGPVSRRILIGNVRMDERVRPVWLDGDRALFLPVCGVRETAPGVDALIWMECEDGRFALATNGNGNVRLHFDVRATFEHILFENYRPETHKPLLAHLPIDYHKIPGPVRGGVARAVTAARLRSKPVRTLWAPEFPVEAAPAALLEALCLCCGVRMHKPGLQAVLSHDVDEPGSVRGIKALAQVESNCGLASAWFVAGKLFQGSRAWIDALKCGGHEIGLHGTRHDFNFAFMAEDKMNAALDKVSRHMDEYEVNGFRSPHYLRTRGMLRTLAARFAYDSSVPDADMFTPCAPGGCGIMRPFMCGDLMEIPVTLPFEIPWMNGTVPEKLVDYWREKMDFSQAAGGTLVVNTHPDAHASGNARMRAAYARLLDELQSRGARFLLPRDLAEMRNGK